MTSIVLCFFLGFDENPELAKLQGTWEMTVQQGDHKIRVVKAIKGNIETVQQFLGDRLLHEHVVEFELIETEQIRIFRWKNGKVTAGEGKGRPRPDGQFVYRVDGDKWFIVFGVLKDDERDPGVELFKRQEPPRA